MYLENLRKRYKDFEEWKTYSDMYGLAKRLGYKSCKAAWKANPLIQSSVNPADFKKVKNKKKNLGPSKQVVFCIRDGNLIVDKVPKGVVVTIYDYDSEHKNWVGPDEEDCEMTEWRRSCDMKEFPEEWRIRH